MFKIFAHIFIFIVFKKACVNGSLEGFKYFINDIKKKNRDSYTPLLIGKKIERK